MTQAATAEQITSERTIFNEAWRILKQYYNLEASSSDAEWEAFIKEAETLSKIETEPKSRLARDITLAIVTHIETVSRERKKHG